MDGEGLRNEVFGEVFQGLGGRFMGSGRFFEEKTLMVTLKRRFSMCASRMPGDPDLLERHPEGGEGLVAHEPLGLRRSNGWKKG